MGKLRTQYGKTECDLVDRGPTPRVGVGPEERVPAAPAGKAVPMEVAISPELQQKFMRVVRGKRQDIEALAQEFLAGGRIWVGMRRGQVLSEDIDILTEAASVLEIEVVGVVEDMTSSAHSGHTRTAVQRSRLERDEAYEQAHGREPQTVRVMTIAIAPDQATARTRRLAREAAAAEASREEEALAVAEVAAFERKARAAGEYARAHGGWLHQGLLTARFDGIDLQRTIVWLLNHEKECGVQAWRMAGHRPSGGGPLWLVLVADPGTCGHG